VDEFENVSVFPLIVIHPGVFLQAQKGAVGNQGPGAVEFTGYYVAGEYGIEDQAEQRIQKKYQNPVTLSVSIGLFQDDPDGYQKGQDPEKSDYDVNEDVFWQYVEQKRQAYVLGQGKRVDEHDYDQKRDKQENPFHRPSSPKGRAPVLVILYHKSV